MIPGDGKRLWSLYIVNISLDPFHNLIWLEYGFLCVLLKTIYSMPLPFHLFNYFLEVLDFASLASGTEKEVFISSVSVQDYVQRAWVWTHKAVISTTRFGTPCYSTTLGIFASFLLCYSCRLGSLEYKNMQRMHVNAVQLQNDINYIIHNLHIVHIIIFNPGVSRPIEMEKPASTTVIIPLSTTPLYSGVGI